MKNMTPRQKSLYLAAKLYELAAEFTDAELKAILQEQSRQSRASAIQDAIKALMKLHSEAEVGLLTAVEPLNEIAPSRDDVEVESRTVRLVPQQAGYLGILFEDRTVFPTVSDIAEALRIEARPKESRERYIARATKLVEAMSSRERAAFFKDISARLNSRPDNFISKWSKLIKEL